MEIRPSTEADLPQIMKIYEYARGFMAENGNPDQWAATNWPPEELIRTHIEDGCDYVCTNEGRIIGTFCLKYGKDIEPVYNVIEGGEWLDDSPYGVIHRISGDGSMKGIGTFCIEWALEKCGHVRIDTHEDNHIMQGLLQKL